MPTTDYSSEPDHWSDNAVLNPGAESGLANWTTSGVTQVATGQAGSYSFCVAEGGSMSQDVTPASGTKKINIGAYYLPEFPQADEADREAKFSLKAELNYSGGTKDIHLSPCEVEQL